MNYVLLQKNYRCEAGKIDYITMEEPNEKIVFISVAIRTELYERYRDDINKKRGIKNTKNAMNEYIKEVGIKTKNTRLKKAYLDVVISLDDYKTEKIKIDNSIENLELKIDDIEISNELRFTPEDILLKRDIDFINNLKYPNKYQEVNKFWKDYTREEKSEFIMRYVDEIELEKNGNKYEVKFIKFRETICKQISELENNGYLDKKIQIFGNFAGQLRFSNYLPIEQVGKHIMRLRQFYDVRFYEADYYVQNQVFRFDLDENK